MKRSTIIWILLVALICSVLLEFVLDMKQKSGEPWWHALTGFFAAYGVIGCFVLVYVAKTLGKIGLQAPEPSVADDAPYDPAEPRIQSDAAAGTTTHETSEAPGSDASMGGRS